MEEPLFYKIIRPVGKVVFDFIYKPNYKNLENIPKTGKIILAGNHTNFKDCLLLIASTKRVIHFMGKHTLFKGIKGYLFKMMAVIPVNRTIKDKACLDSAREVLNNEQVIGIFPEGTINKTKDIIIPFKMGAIKLAFDTDSYIVPFTIKGKYKRKKTTINFGTPYQITSNDLDFELKKLEEIIKEKLRNGE
ncbi:MAG: lysophospholipid acyltransferase family protein [Bacilli bacterium]